MSVARIQDRIGGRWTPAGTGVWTVRLGLDDLLTWHRWQGALEMRWCDGDPVVLSVSEDGHDAWAVHLGPWAERGQRRTVTVPARAWLTAESLGAGGTIELRLDGADGPEPAPADWRPTPRAART